MGQGRADLGYLDAGQNTAPMARILRVLFEPILVDRPFSPKDYDAMAKATEVGEIAFEHRLYKSPPHSVFLMRALIGMEGIVRQLNVPLNYHRLFGECVEQAANSRD
jgi:predicted unusual protein kinase regulating ubiquinone biosynthesis (AarF/ABC1/UbiB family)